MLQPRQPDHKLTVDEFLEAYAGEEERYELIDGVPVMMAGGSQRHNVIMMNFGAAIHQRLRGHPCIVMPSDMGLQISERTFRLPDLAIYCDPRETGPGKAERNRLHHPKVLIEVLSPNPHPSKTLLKLDEYQAIASVDTIVTVSATRNVFTTYERVGEREWRQLVHLPGQPLVLRDPALTIPAEELFENID